MIQQLIKRLLYALALELDYRLLIRRNRDRLKREGHL